MNPDQVHITVNKNKIPNDPQSAAKTSGVRLGTPAVTSRGFNEDDMDEVAQLIYMTAADFEGSKDEISKRVAALIAKYPIYE